MNLERNLVRPMVRIDEGEVQQREIDPANRRYILLALFLDGEKSWEIITGRDEIYNFIVNELGNIDVNKSYVINTHHAVDNRNATVYEFMKFMQDELGYTQVDIEAYSGMSEDHHDNDGLTPIVRQEDYDPAGQVNNFERPEKEV